MQPFHYNDRQIRHTKTLPVEVPNGGKAMVQSKDIQYADLNNVNISIMHSKRIEYRSHLGV